MNQASMRKISQHLSFSPQTVYMCGMRPDEFVKAVQARLRETGQTKHSAAVSHGLPRDAIASVLAGHMPKLDRAAAICDALGLEFYIGRKRPAIFRPDVNAFALTIQSMKGSIAELDADRAEDTFATDFFVQVYAVYVDTIDLVAARGWTREEAAELLRRKDAIATSTSSPSTIGRVRPHPFESDDSPSAEEAAKIVYEAMREPTGEPAVESALPPQGQPEKP